MAKILRIDSSSRLQGSHSRELTDHFQTTWLNKYPQDEIVVRDLVKTPLPHISDLTITGYYTPKEQHTEELKNATALSDKLIEELQSTDILLLSVPMYNFSVPSVLKAWIDQIVRIGYTFAYKETNLVGLATVKKVYVISTYGASGYTKGGSFSTFNFLEPYLKGILNFIGILDVHFFYLQGTTEDEITVAENKAKTKLEIEAEIEA